VDRQVRTQVDLGTNGLMFMIGAMLVLCIGVALAFLALPILGWPVVLAFFAAQFIAMAVLFRRLTGH
jgi:hypothetical protein